MEYWNTISHFGYPLLQNSIAPPRFEDENEHEHEDENIHIETTARATPGRIEPGHPCW